VREVIYRNRTEAGRRLAEAVIREVSHPLPLVLALPRGGVPVGFAVARALDAEFDVFVVRKLGVPGNEELAMGALASGGVRVINQAAVLRHGVSRDQMDAVTERELREVHRRESLYREGRAAIPVEGRVVILVDDGLATGSTLQAAAQAVRELGPAWLVVAVPVGAGKQCARLRSYCDQLICLEEREPFVAVSAWYEDFPQVTDEQVRGLVDSVLRQYAGR
jgi:putative phosphoribosyl transferase